MTPRARKRRVTPAATVARLPPFERVVALHGPAVLRFCAAQAGVQRAEDCFQETMISALRAYDAVRDAGAIRPWLFAIAARKAIDAHRQQAWAPTPIEDVAEVAGAEELRPRDEALWAQVRALPVKQREAVTLRFAGDLSHGEIATLMGSSEAAARRNVFEGLRRLRRDAER